MLAYLETKDESLCCGCRACEQICSQNAISMISNSEGFLYPRLDMGLCVNCSACEKVCPQTSPIQKAEPISIYAVQHSSDEILGDSSSGGAFRLIADKVIELGGCVVGCVFDENLHPIFKIANSIEELLPMQGSKYLSSDTLNIYEQVKERLVKGQLVFFTGTPCQCAGVLNYLKKPYDNLLTAEFLCHGVPSQFAFDSYISYIAKKYRIKDGKKSIKKYRFRDKKKRGWGLVSSCTFVRKNRIKTKYSFELTDSYLYGFLNGYFNRYSCYSCKFRGEKRFADFTFCDFWGIEKFHPEIDKTKGVSALSINTRKADFFKEQIINNATWIKTEAVNVSEYNQSLLQECVEKIPEKRRNIYSLIKENGWESVEKKELRAKHYFVKRIYYAFPLKLQKIIKKVLKG